MVRNISAPVAGAVAGAISALVFTVIHDFLISDIWFMLLPMLAAGAICGLCLAWSYGLLADGTTAAGWLGYNLLYLLFLFLLGPISLLVFEPVITIPALLAAPGGAPTELIQEALPLTAVYTLAMALTITGLYGRRWTRFGAVLLTCAVLVLLLGLNISILGLVALSGGWLRMLSELVGLIVALNLVYALVFLVIRAAAGAEPG